ncbi:MAG: DUF4065 domain-containing protein [Lachnospiraceae bacterium]|nr:DUF4065 domain-containing protein [Lachnospiraceae bacterium]
MEEHEVQMVQVKEEATLKGRKITYDASYMYCDKADELYTDETQMRENDFRLKEAYRSAEGLLTAEEIQAIRGKYGITQGDLCALLGWGGKTITRYESHQVQDRAHDTILRKIDQDPEWFLELLSEYKKDISEGTYRRCLKYATLLYEADKDVYIRKAIEASYARFRENEQLHGNTSLSLDKVVDVIRYFASSSKVANLYKVKLMKLMWYADSLAYKKRGKAITGLVYQALPMGAVPVEHNSIITLKNVPCEEVDVGEFNAFRFKLNGKQKFLFLQDDEKEILDIVIKKFGKMTKSEIVSFMHEEQAYKETVPGDVIPFKYAGNLQI